MIPTLPVLAAIAPDPPTIGIVGPLVAAGLVVVALLGWLAATRVAGAWLRPGHGPLWALAGAGVGLGWATLAIVAAPEAPAVWLSRALDVAAIGPMAVLSQLALSLAALIALFAVARGVFGLVRPRRADRPPVPRWFLAFGVAPDGSALAGFRRAGAWIVGALLIGAITTVAFATDGVDTTAWAAAVTALVGLLMAMTHPTTEARAVSAPVDVPVASRRDALDRRVDALHAWLGAPDEVARLAPAQGLFDDARDAATGRRPYAFQALMAGPERPRALAVHGPDGTGRTTGALMAAARMSLERGATALIVTPTGPDADAVRVLAERLFAGEPAGLALNVTSGPRPSGADVWCASVQALERFLDGQLQLDRHPFVARLGLVAVDDVEALSGYRVPLVRFLLHRVLAGAGVGRGEDAVDVLVLGHLGAAAVETTARCLLARDVVVAPSTGEGGARSQQLRRYLVTEPPPGDLTEEAARLAREANVALEVEGTPWTGHDAAGEDVEVRLVRVGPANAWRVMSDHRYYPPPDGIVADHAREYLALGGDPMARLLGDRAGDGLGWPAWFDATQFPRMLTSVPGDLDAPEGLEVLARHHLRLALAEAPQDAARLAQVFSAAVVDAELQAVRDSGILVEGVGWSPERSDAATSRHRRIVRVDGAASPGWRPEAAMATLREPRAGLEVQVRRELLDLVYYDRAIVDVDGRRYEVREDARGAADARVLVPAPLRASTPIRTTTVRVAPDAALSETHHRFRGRLGVTSLTGRVCLDITHHGTRHFTLSQERVHEILCPAPRPLASFVTSARILSLPTEDAAVLHTLTHAFREVLDYFYLRASESIGVTYATRAELGRAAVVFYDRHPDGLGNVFDVVDGLDWQALLSAAHAILAACDCASSCASCAQSTSCTLRPHNVGLDRFATLDLLEALLGADGMRLTG